MLQELDVICGKHWNCYLVKDTINKWEPFLLAHMNKLSSLLQFWAPAQYCERRKLRVLNVFSFYFIYSFRNQSRFIPNNRLFVFILTPCLLHLFLEQYFSSAFFFLKRKEIGRKRDENTSLLSCEGACLHLCRMCLAKSHFYLFFQRNSGQVPICQFCRRSNSSNGEEGEGVSLMAPGGWKAKAGCYVVLEVLRWPSVWFSSSEKCSN